MIASDLNMFAYYHLSPQSPCIDAGDFGDYTGELDIDGQDRVWGGRVDIGADEYTCGDVSHDLDWNQDGVINLVEYAIFANAWGNYDPNNAPPFNDPNEAWDARADFYADGFIDTLDLAGFLQNWLWHACWRENWEPVVILMRGGDEGGLLESSATATTKAAPAQPQEVTQSDLLGILDWLDEIVESGEVTEKDIASLRDALEDELELLNPKLLIERE